MLPDFHAAGVQADLQDSTHFSTSLSAHLQKWSTLISHSSLTTLKWAKWILSGHTPWSLPPLRPCFTSDSRQGWVCECTPWPRVCQFPNHSLLHLSQCPFIQMIDTDITLLPNYIKVDLARSVILQTGLGVWVYPLFFLPPRVSLWQHKVKTQLKKQEVEVKKLNICGMCARISKDYKLNEIDSKVYL